MAGLMAILLRSRPKRTSITAPGLLLGVGFGGVIDGVVMHQILQWHHMLSSEGCCVTTSLRGLELNTVADGLFHLASIAILAIGMTLLWNRIHEGGVAWSGRQLLGLVLEGWGIFNLVEGLVDHHILGLHHVHGGPYQLAYDIGFLATGGVLVIVGNLLARKGRLDMKESLRTLLEPLPHKAP
jgi:uncharacterized membrane protein